MQPTTVDEWLSYQERLHSTSIDLGLERVIDVRDRLGLRPDFPIITVGGTNGKGSTCAMLETILSCAGYRVGCYTSPHLIRYNERIRIGQTPVSDEDLCAAFSAIETARGDTSLTYFEFGTLAALWLFCKSGLDAAVLEVGLGGRLDAVNAFDADCAIVTSVDLDHQEYLGDTVEAIGFEKAGIFRPGKPAIFSDKQVPASVTQYAAEIGANLQLAGRDFDYRRLDTHWQFHGRRGNRYALPFPALRGSYQLNNAAGVLAALDSLWDVLPIAQQDVKRGLLEVSLPGRLQVLPGRPAVVLDVAHNPHAARVLADSMGSMGFYQNSFAVFSMLQDKDIRSVIDIVKHRFDAWFIAAIDHPRGAPVEFLRQQITEVAPDKPIHAFSSIASAYSHACDVAEQNDRIVVFGSFYTVADVLRVHRPMS